MATKPPPISTPRLYSEAELMRRANVPESRRAQVRELCPPEKVGRTMVYPASALDRVAKVLGGGVEVSGSE